MTTSQESNDLRPVGALLLVLILWIMLSSAYHGMVESGVRGGDFKFFYAAAQRLNAHQPLYQDDPNGATYVYTPLLALLLQPVVGERDLAPGSDGQRSPAAEAEFLFAQKAWFVVSAGALVGAVGLCALGFKLNLSRAAAIGIMLLTAFHLWPTVMTFGLGQANLLLVLTLAGMYWADRQERYYLAAFCIALGTIFKTWFIAMLLFLLLRRAWKASAACLVFLALGMGVLFTIVGWQEFPMFVHFTIGYAAKQMGNQVLSQSIAGFAQLHFLKNDHLLPWVHSPALALAFRGVAYLLVLGGVALVTLLGRPCHAITRQVQLSIVTLTMLLLLPYCQNEYLVLVLPTLWLFLTRPSLGWLGFVITALVYVLFTRGGPYYPLNAREFQHGWRTLVPSLPFFLTCLLWMVSVWTGLRLYRQQRSTETTQVELPTKAGAYA